MAQAPVPEAEWTSFRFCSTKSITGMRPSAAEIVIPPFGLISIILMGLSYLFISNKFNKQHDKLHKVAGDPDLSELEVWLQNSNGQTVVDKIVPNGDIFLSEFDQKVIATWETHFNTLKRLLKLSLPALFSLGLNSLTALLYHPTISCLWPGTSAPDINTAITCFLAPAGLVYALSFGFLFQQVYGKHHGILTKLTNEISLLDQIATMTENFKLPSAKYKMAIYKLVKDETVFTMLQIQNKEVTQVKPAGPSDLKVRIWNILDILREASSVEEKQFNLNRILAEKMISYLMKLNNICSDRIGIMHSKMHPLIWLFLEMLGMACLFGIMLVDASSTRMQVAMTQLTLFSISMLCYVLSDLDAPFDGFFRLQVSILPVVLKRLEKMYLQAENEHMTSVKFGSNLTTITNV